MYDREILNEYDFKFKKKFGQNFLKDKNVLKNIVKKSEIDKETLVIEIGVGAGALTLEMAPYAKNIIGYEIDESLRDILKIKFKNQSNIEIIYGDFLKQDIKKDLEKYEYKKLYIISNLPYYITTPIITKIINDNICVDKMVVMMQKEVGERFTAKTGSKNYGSLTVFLNYYFDIKKILEVSKNCFIPKPKVDSVVIQMNKRKLYKTNNEDLFFKLVRDSFRFKRKNIRNNLKNYDLKKIENVLNKYNLDLSVRAENLDLKLFIEISNHLDNKN